jgi:hypothetical protein
LVSGNAIVAALDVKHVWKSCRSIWEPLKGFWDFARNPRMWRIALLIAVNVPRTLSGRKMAEEERLLLVVDWLYVGSCNPLLTTSLS